MDKLILESVNDKYYNKAIFVVGPPGSGKTFITKKLIDTFHFKVMDSDDILVRMMKKDNLDLKLNKHEGADREKVLDNVNDAYEINRRRTLLAASKRIPIVLSRTGRQANDILDLKKKISNYGYDILLIIVNSNLETTLKRNAERERTVDPKYLTVAHNGFRENVNTFKKSFETYIEVDNENITPRELHVFEKQIRSWANMKMEKE